MFIVVCKHLVNCANMFSYSLCFELLLQIYVTKDGKEMTGQLAYRQYRRVIYEFRPYVNFKHFYT